MDKALLKAHCLVCHNPEARRRCGQCGVPHYCGVECGQKDWPRHKKECKVFIERGMQGTIAAFTAGLAAGGGSVNVRLFSASGLGRLGEWRRCSQRAGTLISNTKPLELRPFTMLLMEALRPW